MIANQRAYGERALHHCKIFVSLRRAAVAGAREKSAKKLAPLGGNCYLCEIEIHSMQNTAIKESRNYHNMSKLHLLIGGGNFLGLPSLGLDIWRSSVCNKHIGGRFSCALPFDMGESLISNVSLANL